MAPSAGPSPETSALAVALLAELVGYRTLSEGDNLALIDCVARQLGASGIRAHRVPHADGNRAGLVATVGDPARPGIVLSAHTDVVGVEGQQWRSDPFSLVERDGRLFGRGTVDMKGFIACALAMMTVWATRSSTPTVHLVLSYDEEIGCRGSDAMVAAVKALGLAARAVIVGEPTDMETVVGHKGKVALKVAFQGSAGHSSMPSSGVNAIYAASGFVQAIRAAQARIEARGPFNHRHGVPHSTLHVGLIAGGTALNVIPDHAEVAIEGRIIGAQPIAQMRTMLERAARKAAGKVGATATITELSAYPGLATDPGDGFALAAARLGGSGRVGWVDYGTEAGIFARDLGVPTIVCGPGDIARAHKPDEYILRGEIDRCLRFLDAVVAAAP